MKKLGSIACLAFVVALMASPVAQGASPVRGLWTGTETKYRAGGKWLPYSQIVPLRFHLGRGKVVGFDTSSKYVWPGCTGGETVTSELPTTRKAKVRHGQFRSKQTTHVGSRKMTMYVSGSFASASLVRGKIVVKITGCPAYRSVWKANSGVNPDGFHIPICRGQNVTMPDGSFHYNPCAYIAGAR